MASNLALQFQVLWKRRELERSCRWTAEQLANHQQKQTADIRAFALKHSPFYARYHRGLENRPLEDLPILTKSILMENFDELITDRSIRVKAHSAGVEQHYASLWATVPLNRRR